jgi:hypothetical protein
MAIVSDSPEGAMCEIHRDVKAVTSIQLMESDNLVHMCDVCERSGYYELYELFHAWQFYRVRKHES